MSRFKIFFGQQGSTAIAVTADAGSYAVTGSAATLAIDFLSHSLSAGGGSYAVSGQAATLRTAAKNLTAGGGSYSVTGQTALLYKGRQPRWSNTIASTSFNYIHGTDPDAFENVEYLGVSVQDMPGGSRNVFRYRATFVDTTHPIYLYMDATGRDGFDGIYPAYASEAAARVDVDRYTPRLGKLPLVYRENIHHMVGYPGDGDDTGDEDLTSEDAGHFFAIFADRATTRIANNDLEESFFHEGSHASVQKAGTSPGPASGLGAQDYLNHPAWAAARAADLGYVTTYASTAQQEDFAESGLFAYTLMLHPERLPEDDRLWVQEQIPNRIAFFQDIVFAGPHLACARVPAANVANALPARFIESLEDNTSLEAHCRDLANLKIEAFYSHGTAATDGLPDLYKFHCTVCDRVHLRSCLGGEPRPFWERR